MSLIEIAMSLVFDQSCLY